MQTPSCWAANSTGRVGEGAGEGRIADARSKDGHPRPPLVDRVRLRWSGVPTRWDGCFFIFERTCPFRILRDCLGSIWGRRGSSKLEALSWDGITDSLGRPEQLEKKMRITGRELLEGGCVLRPNAAGDAWSSALLRGWRDFLQGHSRRDEFPRCSPWVSANGKDQRGRPMMVRSILAGTRRNLIPASTILLSE